MTKEILVQYCELREEVKDLHRRVQKLKDQIQKIEDSGAVIDSVTGGDGGIQHFKIIGFPYPEYSRKKTRLYMNMAQLENSELELLGMVIKVEEFIQSVDNSRIRRIIRYRIIDDMSWPKVAINIGGKNTTDESVRKEFERFFNQY